MDPTMRLQNLFSLPGHRFSCRVPAAFSPGFSPKSWSVYSARVSSSMEATLCHHLHLTETF